MIQIFKKKKTWKSKTKACYSQGYLKPGKRAGMALLSLLLSLPWLLCIDVMVSLYRPEMPQALPQWGWGPQICISFLPVTFFSFAPFGLIFWMLFPQWSWQNYPSWQVTELVLKFYCLFWFSVWTILYTPDLETLIGCSFCIFSTSPYTIYHKSS